MRWGVQCSPARITDSENKDLAENGQGVSEYANGWVTGDNDTFFYIDGIKLYDAGCEIDGYWYYLINRCNAENYWREKME